VGMDGEFKLSGVEEGRDFFLSEKLRREGASDE